MAKNIFEHPAYKETEEDLSVNNQKELEEAKKAAGVTTHEELMERFIELEPDWEEKDKSENIWGIEAFEKLVKEAGKEEFEELAGEMKDYEGDREKFLK